MAARRAGLAVVEKLLTNKASKGLPGAERGHQAEVGVEAPCQSPLSGVVEVGVDALSGQCDDSRSWPRDHPPRVIRCDRSRLTTRSQRFVTRGD